MKSISFVNIYFIWLDKIIIQSVYFVNDLKRIKQIFYNDISIKQNGDILTRKPNRGIKKTEGIFKE